MAWAKILNIKWEGHAHQQGLGSLHISQISILAAFPWSWEIQLKKREVDRPELLAQRLSVRKIVRIRGRFLRTTLQLANSSSDCFFSISERYLMLPPFRCSSEELSDSDLLLTYELTKNGKNKGKLQKICFLGTINIMWLWKIHWKLDLLAWIQHQRGFKSLSWVFGVGWLGIFWGAFVVLVLWFLFL